MTKAEKLTVLANVKTHAEKLKHAVYDAWRKQNPDAQGGMILSPQALKGAKDAINDKYGPGTVTW
jgi:hypothetical protein